MTKSDMDWNELPRRRDEPDFNNLLTVLRKELPHRPTLFEFYLNDRLYGRVVPGSESTDPVTKMRCLINAFHRYGYDYTTILIPGFSFSDRVFRQKKETHSLNEGAVIRNREEFDHFTWPDPDTPFYGIFDLLAEDLPQGMKLIPYSPDGILENVINLMGYDTLCYMILDDPRLVEDVFTQVGQRLVQYYRRMVRHDCVGACLANDDWGFKSSTLLSPEDLGRLVFPWYKRIVEEAHSAGKPVILHSCGYFEEIIEDIIEEMQFDGRHSYEDMIMPVEVAYEKYHHRMAVMGGIDVDFMCRSTPEDIYERSKAMLEVASQYGGYALGTGNSVPDYLPDSHYFAMIRAALDMR